MKFKKGDLLAIALVLAAAAALFAFVGGKAAPPGPAVAVIYQDGRPVRRVDLTALSAPVVFSVDGPYHNEITAEYGRIRVSGSDCPGGDCRRSGWLHRPGKSIVCLPNRMEIRLEGGEGDVDATAR